MISHAYFTDTEITITPPAGEPVIINTTTGDALLTAPTAIDRVEVTWTSSSGRDHQAPGTARLVIITTTPNPAWLQWDAAVTVDTWAAYEIPGQSGLGSVPLFRGWIEEITTTRRRAGLQLPETWQHVIVCTDAVGRAQGTVLSAPPWVAASADGRVADINAASPSVAIDALGVFNPAEAPILAPRDVDATPLIEVAREVAETILSRLFANGLDGSLDLQPLTGNAIAYLWGMAPKNYSTRIIPLSATQLTDSPRSITRAAHLTDIVIRHVRTNPDDPDDRIDGRLTMTGNPGGMSAVYNINTAAWIDWNGGDSNPATSPMLAAHRAYSASLLRAEHQPVISDRVALARPNITGPDGQGILLALAGLATRGMVILDITDAPAGIYPRQRVIGSRVTITGKPEAQLVELDLEPITLNGQRPLTFADLERVPEATFREVEPEPGYTAATIEDTIVHTPPPETLP